jgi:hypothetical protein
VEERYERIGSSEKAGVKYTYWRNELTGWLTEKGRKALSEYLKTLEEIVHLKRD